MMPPGFTRVGNVTMPVLGRASGGFDERDGDSPKVQDAQSDEEDRPATIL